MIKHFKQSRYPGVSAFCWLVLLSHFSLPLAAQPWWDSQFGYSQQIFVQTGPNKPLNGYIGYTVRLENLNTAALVAAGRLTENCNDLRLAYWDGSNWTEVDRHVIDCNTAASEIRFMLRVEIAANGSDDGYYLYYGAPSAGAPTPLGTDNVYLWYDDASVDRLASYIRGRGDDWHGSGWGDSFGWNGDGYYTYDTGNNATDSLRRAVAERDLYIEAAYYHLSAYENDMTSGLLVRYLSENSNESESSSHYYASNRADSPFQSSSGYPHDLSIMKNSRNNIAIGPAGGEGAPPIKGNQWRKQALAVWGINSTNGKFWDDDVSADLGPMGWPSAAAAKAGTDDSSSDNESAGDAGLIVAQDKARVDNILIRRYVEPEPTVSLTKQDDRLLSYHAMDESGWSGTVGEVVDGGSYGYSGTAVNGAKTGVGNPAIAGNPGTCDYGVFDGDDDYVSLPDYPDLTGSFTIAAWIYPSEATDSQNDWRIFADDQNNSEGFALSLHDRGNGRLRFFSRGVSPVSLDAPDNRIINQNQWNFVAAVHDAATSRRSIYLDGQFIAQDTYSGTWGVDSGLATIGGEPAGGEDDPRWRFDGFIDEMRVYQSALSEAALDRLMGETHACNAVTSTLDHLRILHDGEGLICAPEEVTIQACETSGCDILYTGEVTVDLSPSGWVGGDSVSFSGGQTTVELRQTSVGTVTLGSSASSPSANNPTRCFMGSAENCDMNFSDAGFIFNVLDQVSCETSAAVIIQAVKTSDTDISCAPAFNGARTVNFQFDYADPASGTRSLKINGSEVSDGSTGTDISLDFDDLAQASFSVSYADAGRLQLNARYEGTGDESDLVLNGNDQFVIRPQSLYSRATTDGTTLLNNATSGGAPSWTAGADFQLQLRAQCADGTLLPNYQPTNAELWVEMSSPAVDGGSLSLLEKSFAAVTKAGWNNISALFSKGVVVESKQDASDTTSHALARFSEVGVLTLHLRDDSYMGGEISPADDLVVGRFKPAYFEVSDLTHGKLSPSCNDDFSYTGTTMNYAEQPGIKITAHNREGGVSANYTGAFSKLNGEEGSVSFDPPPSKDAAQLGADEASNTDLIAQIESNMENIVDNKDGTFNYTLSLLDSFTYTRNANALIGPYTGKVNLALKAVVDGDGVRDDGTAVSLTPVGSEIRFGRLVVDDAYGPQTSDLPVPVRAEYFDGNGFIDNTDDFCTVIDPPVAVGLDIWQGSLTEGETAVGASSGLQAGSGEIVLTAPGIGDDNDTNDGSVVLSLDLSETTPVQNWLLNDEDGDGRYEENPAGTASFGMYRGDDRFIYWRETQ